MAYAGMTQEFVEAGMTVSDANLQMEELMLPLEERQARENQRAFAQLGIKPPPRKPRV